MSNHTSYHNFKRSVSPFRNTIHRKKTWHSVLWDDIVIYTMIFTAKVWSDAFYSLVEWILNFKLKIFWTCRKTFPFHKWDKCSHIYQKSSMNVIKYCWPFQETVWNDPQILVCLTFKTPEVLLALNLLVLVCFPFIKLI